MPGWGGGWGWGGWGGGWGGLGLGLATGAVIGAAVAQPYYAEPYYAQPYAVPAPTYACGGYVNCAPAEGYAYPAPYSGDPDPNGY